MSQQATKKAAPRAAAASSPKPPPKYPLWVRWVALIVFVAVLAVVFVNLGEWQLRRLDERRAENAVILRNEKAPVQDFSTAFGGPIGEDQEFQRVEVTGTFDAEHSYVIRYRKDDGETGYEAVVPLKTADGQSVLVDRGFVTVAGGDRIPDTVPAPPTGTVTILGRVRASETGPSRATTPVDGQARLINTAAISKDLGYPLVDGYLDVVSMKPADTAEFAVRTLPEVNDGPHFWYAVQWFMFTGIGVLGVIVFIRGDLRERRARKAAEPSESGKTGETGETGS